jgi:hypothetical protein
MVDSTERAKIDGICWLSNPRWRSLRFMGDFVRTSIRTYRDSFQGIGCRTGCMIHLALLGVIGVALLIWAIKIRVWEFSVTVEMPAKKAPEAPPEPPPP